MHDSILDPNLSKYQFYAELELQIRAVLDGQRNRVTNLANASSLIFHGMNSINAFKNKPINWAGFYLTDKIKSDWLYLGPFQGKVGCTMIKYGRGVCGTAAQTRQTQVVKDVHQFFGHIACDSGSNSEIVVPLINPDNEQEVLGVLDIDGLVIDTFDEDDKLGLERICKYIIDACDWD